jgi:hypothetical protein
MKIKTISIGNLIYSIEYVDNLTCPLVDLEEEASDLSELITGSARAFGLINYDDQTIKIDKSVKIERERITLLHEILHGLDEHYPYLEIDEMKADTMASLIIDFIDDNPLFILFLLFSSVKLKNKIKKLVLQFLKDNEQK